MFFLTFSCKKENISDCFKTNSTPTSEIRYLEAFDYLVVNNKIDVTINQGAEYKVEVIASKQLLKKISTKINGGVLTIENNNGCGFVRGYKKNITVNITLPHIKKVTNAGVGPIKFAEGFSQDTLIVRAGSSGDFYINGNFNELRTSSHGNGDLYIDGTCNSFFVYANGINFVHAEKLSVKDHIFVETKSIGDCFIDASGVDLFDYNIHSIGNIYYTGQPANISDYSKGDGKGKAINKD